MKTSLAAICCALAIAGCASSTDNTPPLLLPLQPTARLPGNLLFYMNFHLREQTAVLLK
jgi:hypothetical protein